MALTVLAPMTAGTAGAARPERPAAMGTMTAARAVGAAMAALRSAGPDGIAVDLALPVTALTESAPGAMPVRASALPVAEGFAVPVTMPGRRGTVHGELRDRPRRHVALDAGQRSPDQAAVQADLGVRRWRLVLGGLNLWRLPWFDAGSSRGRDDVLALLLHRSRFILDGRHSHHLARRGERRRPGHGFLPAARRHFPAPVLVFGVARRAPDLADVVADERHDRMVAQPPLARAVVIDKITNPKLARMHAQSLENAWWDEDVAGRRIPAKPRNAGQPPPATAIRGPRCRRPEGNEKQRSSAS
jgi:hypothetical protein